jgi:hypothetical protein
MNKSSPRAGCCLTCRKWNITRGGCDAYEKPVGKDRPCSGWTDDPDWERKLAVEIENYRQRRIKRDN